MPRIRIEVYAFSRDALKDNIAEIARDTGFVPEPNVVEPIMESTWWVYGTGPANLEHDLVRSVELAGRPEPLISLPPKPQPACPVQPLAPPTTRRLRLHIRASSARQALLSAQEVAAETLFVLDEKIEAQHYAGGVWVLYGTGPADLNNELVEKVVSLEGRLKVVIEANSPKQALLTARAIAKETTFVLDEGTAPTVETAGQQPAYAVYGNGLADLKHELVDAVSIVG